MHHITHCLASRFKIETTGSIVLGEPPLPQRSRRLCVARCGNRLRKSRLGAPWAQAHLDATLDDDRAGAGFGARGAVAADGDAIVVGAAPEDDDAGAAYVSCEATCAAAAYAFEDDVDAEGGAGPDGTLIGDAAYGTGMAGRGLVFSGVAGEYVEFPVALTARLGGAAPRSVCLWAKDVAFNGGALFAYGTQTGNELFSLKTKDSALEFNLKVGPGAANDHKFTVDGWTADAWHHLCVVLSLIHI